jgi:hypothetical protein
MSNQPNPNVFFQGEDMGIGNFPIKGGKINDGGPAFPHTTQWDGITPAINYHGMTLRQYAAIKLCVPDSGLPWLDDMIAKSRNCNVVDGTLVMFRSTDAMLKAREAK